VVSETVDEGQYVAPGQAVATVYDTSCVEIPVPLRDEELAWFDVPGRDDAGARAEVSTRFARKLRTWSGRVVRTEGEVDAATRMVRVVAAVDRPFAGDDGTGWLVPGTFVDVAIDGRTIERAFSLPRHAVHDGVAWIAADGRLRLHPVTVAYTEGDRAYVTAGLDDGDVVITSQLEVVSDGMRVRTEPAEGLEDGAQPAAPAGNGR
jgi:RND family efflux transporter MFP subunit